MHFTSRILILPGLGNSGEQHWQSRWEKQFPELERVHQRDWEGPHCGEWIDTRQKRIREEKEGEIILVAHSLACATVSFWAQHYSAKVKGALLVAPSDTEATSYPAGTTGFTPVPMIPLPFRSFVVASENDFYVSLLRARQFAVAWGSEFRSIGKAGHINVASGFGDWKQGIELLENLDG